jgi:hypothetical protein
MLYTFRQLSKIHRFQVMFVHPKGKSSVLRTGCRPVVPQRQERNRGRERESKKKNTQGSQKFKRNILNVDFNWCYLGQGFNWLTWALLMITPVSGLCRSTTFGLAILVMTIVPDHLNKSFAETSRALELTSLTDNSQHPQRCIDEVHNLGCISASSCRR